MIEPDGKLRRFDGNGKRGDDSGWYVLHGDAVPAGCFGDWRTGLSQTWRADIGRSQLGRFIPTGVGVSGGLRSRERPPWMGGLAEATGKCACGATEMTTRFIPTGVGNRLRERRTRRRNPVHPHRRGEQRCPRDKPTPKRGSSPQAWGTAHTHTYAGNTSRFIPTGVGNRLASASRYSAGVGSSPQAWGTGSRRGRPSASARFIPTGVGNSSTIKALEHFHI